MSEREVSIRPTEDGGLLIYIPMLMRRHFGRKLIIAPKSLEGESTDSHSPTQERLIAVLARSYAWNKLLDEGRFASTKELATALEKDPSYVARVLRLNSLAPDIVQAILDGREPDGLSFMKMIKVLSCDWQEQREALGFT